MTRHDLQRLMAVRGYPAVSILCRTHRTYPDRRQDTIRIGLLLAEAERRLRAEFAPRDVEPMLRRIDACVSTMDVDRNLDGLAIFVNGEVAEWFRVPFPVEDRVVIDEAFATRDLLHALNRSDPYRVLCVGERECRLFEGVRDELAEVTGAGFPMLAEPRAVEAPPRADRGMDDPAGADERRRRFFRAADRALATLHACNPLPIIVVGGLRPASVYGEISRLKGAIVGTVFAWHDAPTPHFLGKRVWPVMSTWILRRNAALLDELDRAVGAGRFVSTVEGAWRAAQEGRGATLLVEESFRFPARVASDGWSLTPAADPTAPDVLDDAIDELIEAVISHGGRAIILPDATLHDHGRMSLLLRY